MCQIHSASGVDLAFIFDTESHQQNMIVAFKLLVATVFRNNIDKTSNKWLMEHNLLLFSVMVGGGDVAGSDFVCRLFGRLSGY